MPEPAARPRILHVVSRIPYYGGEHLVDELCRTLATRGERVAVMTMYESPFPQTREPAYETIAIRRGGSADAGFFFRMVGAIRRFRPDVVNTHMHNGKYWGRLAAVAAGARHIVHTEHNSAFASSPPTVLANRLLHPATQRFVALSRVHAERLASAERIPAHKIAIVPNGISVLPALPGARERARAALGITGAAMRAVLHVGRLYNVKNHRLSIRSFAALGAQMPHVRLFIVGGGDEETSLRALVREMRLGERVTFLGFRDDVQALLPGADALILTSTNEAMPMTVIEAMLAGVPVATTPWEGAAEMLEDGRLGCIARGWEPPDVADALDRALRGDPNATARTLAARAAALDRYDIERTADRYTALYRELLIRG